MIDHSRFTKWCTWEEQDNAEDEFGQKDPEAWTPLFGQRCQIERLNRYSEKQEAGKETAKSGIKVITRYRQAIAHDRALRIKYKGTIYDIEDIENVGQENRFLIFYATTTDTTVAALSTIDSNPLGGLAGGVLGPMV